MKEYIYNIIPEEEYITRKELVEKTGLSDRTIRSIISEIRKEHSIISLNSGKGYKKSKSTDDMTEEEMKIEYEIIKHQIKESNSRIKSIKANMRSSIARLKVLERMIEYESNNNI